MSASDFSAWDADLYAEMYYLSSAGDQWNLGLMDRLSHIFNSGKIKGETLLDIGTGPVIYSLISAAPHFSQIYLSDFLETNRNALWRWHTKHPRKLDFSYWFSYVNEKEQPPLSCQDQEDDMRSRIKGILHSDYTLSNPLQPAIFPQFDVITSSFAFCLVPGATVDAYETAVKNAVSLLKPGGWFVYVDTIGGSFYVMDKTYKRFPQMTLRKEIVLNAMKKAGLRVDMYFELERTAEEIANDPLDDTHAECCLAAQKVTG